MLRCTDCQLACTPFSSYAGSVLLGGLDALVRVFEASSSYSDKPKSKTAQTLNDHYDNICHLSVYEATQDTEQTLAITGSWDCTSRVYRVVDETTNGSLHLLHTLKGHKAAVWAAEVVDSSPGAEKYLTGG